MKPKVSCYCPTYGKSKLLEEAIYSFLNQDYDGEKELVILNDLVDQTLIFDHPQVKIINSKQRIYPLGKKLNECLSYCSGEYIFVWDDDDIYFPWKISFSINNISKDGIFHTNQAFFEEINKTLSISKNLFHSNLCMHKNIWEKNNYIESDVIALDVFLFNKINYLYKNISKIISDEDIFYIYRWASTSNYHGSFFKENVSLNVAKYVDQKILNKTEPIGNIVLNPQWKSDYSQARKNCLQNQK